LAKTRFPGQRLGHFAKAGEISLGTVWYLLWSQWAICASLGPTVELVVSLGTTRICLPKSM